MSNLLFDALPDLATYTVRCVTRPSRSSAEIDLPMLMVGWVTLWAYKDDQQVIGTVWEVDSAEVDGKTFGLSD